MKSRRKLSYLFLMSLLMVLTVGTLLLFSSNSILEQYKNQSPDSTHSQFWILALVTAKYLSPMILVLNVTLIYVNYRLIKKEGTTTIPMNPLTGSSAGNGISSNSETIDDLKSFLQKEQELNRIIERQFRERTIDLQNEMNKRKKLESALRDSEERFQTLVEQSPDAIIVHSEERCIYGNSAALEMFQIGSMEALKAKSIFEFMNVLQSKLFRNSFERIVDGSELSILSKYSFIRPNGEIFFGEVTATKLPFQIGTSIQIMIRDITERSKNERQRIELEQQLLHIQKKEIISTLASGIAHDILNILGIIGTSINKLTFMKEINQSSVNESAEQISKATERGRSLVRQLLNFARKSELNFDLIQINTVIVEIASIIQRTFPISTLIDLQLADDLPMVRADGNQIHQAMLNLCLNARDAITDAGTIIISTSCAERLCEDDQSRGSSKKFICISISDNGCGMSKEVMENIFQPFFTTKNEGEGSGLGLAMVNGIMENHRGIIELESDVGKGTTFRLLFPV